MTSFQDRIKKTLASVDPRHASAGLPAPFDQVLGEFVEALVAAEPALGAAIEKGSPQQMRAFVTWPRYRRDERSIMLTFWWDGTTMRVMNEAQRPGFTSPDELGDYLVEFLEKSAFPSTLVEYQNRTTEDLDGFLRTISLADASPKDAMVVVSAEDQRLIATAKPGEVVNLQLDPQTAAGVADYNSSENYAFLLSGGYALRVLTHGLAGGKVHLSGERAHSGP